jgi:hypothetical protein
MKHKRFSQTLLLGTQDAIRPIARFTGAISEYLRNHPEIQLGLNIGLLFSLFWLVCFQRLDPDFGWHLRTGQYITLTHHVPLHDLYTFTAHSFRWIDHEWGNDVVMAWLYAHGGYAAVATLFAGLWTAALIVAARKARLHVLLIGALAIMPYVGTRPLAWTTLFFAILLTTLRAPQHRYRRWLPLLFILWANIHGGFIAGLAVVAYFAVTERSRRTAYLFLLCVAATMINAYGPRLYVEVFRTLADPALHSQINEWFAFALKGVSWFMVALWIAGGLAVNKKRQLFGLSGLLFLTALSASRNLPLFAMSALSELDASMTGIMAAMPKKLDTPRRFVKTILISAIVITIYCIVAIVISEVLSTQREAGYPAGAVTYLQQHPCQGNLFNGYGTGGYLIWKLPQQPVYIDGRMPTWQPYMNRYEAIVHNPEKYYPKEFKRLNIHCALLSNQTVGPHNFADILRSAHWQNVYTSHDWQVLTDR